METVSRCETPFANGPGLCRICNLATGIEGLKKCSRVVAESPPMRELMLRAAPIAAADVSVILLGESGTGKEVLARALHANSPRRAKPFVAVNVAALPSELLESELFGHVKGAFTGAISHKEGLFEAAHGGTLLLDEIAEMPLALQAKLLRVLQEGEVRRVGDTRAFSVDVRILCATHRDLESYVERGLFREDLYYRLNVFTLRVPSLRDRREDVIPLADHFLSQERHDAGLTREAADALQAYSWPGNIRELGNAIKHGAVLSRGAPIEAKHLPEAVTSPPRSTKSPLRRTLAEAERDHVLAVLEACGGNQVEASRTLQIGRNTLWRKLRAYREENTACAS
jgi:two-component system response regulator HydG